MVYENHLKCYMGTPDTYNNQSLRFASFTTNYTNLLSPELSSFVNMNGTSVVVTDNRLRVYANTAYANLDDGGDGTSMELDRTYYLYIASPVDDKILAKVQGNIARQPAPVVSDFTVLWDSDWTIRGSGNITNTIPFEYYILVTQNEQSEDNLVGLINDYSMDASTAESFDTIFSIPYDVQDDFPFLQYVESYHMYVYAVNNHAVVSVTHQTLHAQAGYTKHDPFGFSNVVCVNMGNIEDPDAISLNITFEATHTGIEYYATVFPNTEYTNRDIYTSMHVITGNTTSIDLNRYYDDSLLQINTDVYVAILAVDEITRQFSGTAYQLELNISLPVVISFGVIPLDPD